MYMGTKRLQFRSKPDINGHSLSLVIDMENKIFSWCNHHINSDFITIKQHDIRAMREQLKWFGYKEL